MRKTAFLLMVLTAFSARAEEIEPGLWEFTVNTQAEGLGAFQPKPGPSVYQRCITAEQAANPEKALIEAGAKGQCEFSNPHRIGIQFNFDVRCTAPFVMSGSGSVRYTAEALSGDVDLNGDMKGMKFKTRSQINARRLGPCSG